MRGDGDGCEVCTGTLGPGAQENVCRGCLISGGQWAHRQLERLWNAGLKRGRIAELLGYAPGTVSTLVRRMRSRGIVMQERR
jgi:CRP-like cAMP-binding protein